MLLEKKIIQQIKRVESKARLTEADKNLKQNIKEIKTTKHVIKIINNEISSKMIPK